MHLALVSSSLSKDLGGIQINRENFPLKRFFLPADNARIGPEYPWFLIDLAAPCPSRFGMFKSKITILASPPVLLNI